jgi:hypothetical protein
VIPGLPTTTFRRVSTDSPEQILGAPVAPGTASIPESLDIDPSEHEEDEPARLRLVAALGGLGVPFHSRSPPLLLLGQIPR